MQTKNIIALAISFLISAGANSAHAEVQPFFNPDSSDTSWYSDDCAPADFYGYRVSDGYSLYRIPALLDGESGYVSGYRNSNVYAGTGYFTCSKGYLYYVDGPAYIFADWYNAS